MKTARKGMGGLLFLLALGVATSAVLGPLVTGVIEFRVSENMENQWMGAEAVSLLLVAPLAVAAAVLWLRGNGLAPVIAFGPAVYVIYNYFTAIVFPEYERYSGNNEKFFPLYVGLVMLGAIVAVVSWRTMDERQLPLLTRRSTRLVAAVLMLIGALIALTWIRQIADVLADETSMIEYQEHPTGFWTIKLLDLALIVPALIGIGVGLLSRNQLAVRAITPLSGFLGLLVSSVAGMALVMLWRDDPSASVPFAVLGTLAAALLLLQFGWLLKATSGDPSTSDEAARFSSPKPADRAHLEARFPSD